MSMVEDLRTARRLVRNYLLAMGGERNGHTMTSFEDELVDAIAGELGNARRAASEPRPPLAAPALKHRVRRG